MERRVMCYVQECSTSHNLAFCLIRETSLVISRWRIRVSSTVELPCTCRPAGYAALRSQLASCQNAGLSHRCRLPGVGSCVKGAWAAQL